MDYKNKANQISSKLREDSDFLDKFVKEPIESVKHFFEEKIDEEEIKEVLHEVSENLSLDELGASVKNTAVKAANNIKEKFDI